ncbi:hypothetical protein BRC83_00430 [Halobacteriales archaeon QS_1_68_17]|nr:MAG: hypothetical protein BRC83_00430 [Halobacteriales archaeon QS_1_68_17]
MVNPHSATGGSDAGPAGAASATGHGEDIARTTLARQAVALLGGGHDPDEAAERAVSDLAASTGGTAGVIVVDPDGTAGTAHNAAAMGTSDARE